MLLKYTRLPGFAGPIPSTTLNKDFFKFLISYYITIKPDVNRSAVKKEPIHRSKKDSCKLSLYLPDMHLPFERCLLFPCIFFEIGYTFHISTESIILSVISINK